MNFLRTGRIAFYEALTVKTSCECNSRPPSLYETLRRLFPNEKPQPRADYWEAAGGWFGRRDCEIIHGE